MASGNSTRDVNLNTDSSITTTILIENTGTIPVVDTPTTTLADATASDEVTTFTVVVDGTGPTLTTKTLAAGTDIALVKVGDVIRIDNSGGAGGAGAVALESVNGPPVAGPPAEYALFAGADPQAAAATVSLKKLKSTSGTVTITDDGEFIDLAATLGSTSGVMTGLVDSQPTSPYASVIAYGGTPYATLKQIVPADQRITVTQDANYVYIGSNYSLTNTLPQSFSSFALVGGSGAAPVMKTLQPGSGITMTQDAYSVTISSTTPQLNNVRLANNSVNTAVSSGTVSVAVGSGSSASSSAVAVGAGAGATLSSISLGNGAQCTTDTNVSIGFAAQSTSTDCIAIGASTQATALGCTAVGTASVANQNYTTILGSNNTTTQPYSILVGNNIANTMPYSFRVQTDGKRMLDCFGPNSAAGPRAILPGPLWTRTGNLKRYDRADLPGNTAAVGAVNISPSGVIWISRNALTGQGSLTLPGYAAVLAMFGSVAPTTPMWWFRVINNDGSNKVLLSATVPADTILYGVAGAVQASVECGQTEMIAMAAFLDTANARMKYSIMVKYG